MCFSAEASFTVGTILGVIGITTLKKVKEWPLRFIALIPLFFGIQQLAEGVVWLNMKDEFHANAISVTAQMIFLSFAWVVWPVYVPIVFYNAEKVAWRKGVCVASFLMGLIITYVGIRYLVNVTFYPTVLGRSIYYPTTNAFENFCYGLSTLVPILVSSIPQMWIFGVFLLLSFITAQVIWAFTFTSVWCFLAAGVSLILLKVLSQQQAVLDVSHSKMQKT